MVDANGIQPTVIGNLPPQLAALTRTMINVQSLAVEACMAGDVDAIYHAVMLDPLTGAVCTLPQIRAMVDEMLAAQKIPLIAYHFPWPGHGHVAKQGDGFRYYPAPMQMVL